MAGSSSTRDFREFSSREYRCPRVEELADEAFVEIGVEIGAAILDHRGAEIGVRGFEQSGKNDSARGDAEKDERIDVIGAENHREVGAGERADAVFRHDNFAFSRCDGRRDRSERTFKEFLMLG